LKRLTKLWNPDHSEFPGGRLREKGAPFLYRGYGRAGSTCAT